MSEGEAGSRRNTAWRSSPAPGQQSAHSALGAAPRWRRMPRQRGGSTGVETAAEPRARESGEKPHVWYSGADEAGGQGHARKPRQRGGTLRPGGPCAATGKRAARLAEDGSKVSCSRRSAPVWPTDSTTSAAASTWRSRSAARHGVLRPPDRGAGAGSGTLIETDLQAAWPGGRGDTGGAGNAAPGDGRGPAALRGRQPGPRDLDTWPCTGPTTCPEPWSRIRRGPLRPDGLFLAALIGGGHAGRGSGPRWSRPKSRRRAARAPRLSPLVDPRDCRRPVAEGRVRPARGRPRPDRGELCRSARAHARAACHGGNQRPCRSTAALHAPGRAGGRRRALCPTARPRGRTGERHLRDRLSHRLGRPTAHGRHRRGRSRSPA